jgi:hypothetical protein
MKRTFVKQFGVALFALLAVMVFSTVGYGQAKINLPEGRYVSVGGGFKSSFRANETGSGTGTYNQNFMIESVRLYINSEFHKDFAIEVNTEFDGSSDIGLLDAVVKYQPSEKFNIWMGRHITPSDRSNLDGPYFLSSFDYPTLVSLYPSIFAGRDDGVSVSGKIQEGKVKYAFGIYEGAGTFSTDTNLYAGRITVNIFDSEPDAGGKSGYYTASTYYGDVDQILTIGIVGQYQDNVVLGPFGVRSFFGYNADLLYEKKLMNDAVVTFEGALYKYNIGFGNFSSFGVQDGSAFLLSAAYLLPNEIGIGKLQPIARYQDYINAGRLDLGSNFIIKGHSARLSFLYSPTYSGGAWNNRVNNFTGGAQFQF